MANQDFFVEVLGEKTVLGKLDTMKVKVREEVKAVVNEAALNIQRKAKRRTPVDTGRLRASIHVKHFNNGLASEVGSDVEYAPYVEFGTGGFVEVPQGAQDYANQFRGKHPANPGQHAQPYLYPAWEDEKPDFEAKLAAILGKAGE